MKKIDNSLRRTLFVFLLLASILWGFVALVYPFRNIIRNPWHIFMLFIVIIFVGVLLYFYKPFKPLLTHILKFIYVHKYWSIGFLLLFQIFIALFAQGIARSDASVLYTVATGIPVHEEGLVKYFSLNPNNFLILVIFKIINSVVSAKYLILAVSILNAVLIDAGILLLTALAKRLNGDKLSLIVFIESLFLIGLQPQFLYFYTDPCTFFLTSLLCYLVFMCQHKKNPLSWFVIGLIFGIAYQIRVPVAVYLIAFIMVVAYQFIFSSKKVNIKQLLVKGIFLFFGVFVMTLGVQYYAHHQKFTEYDTKYSRDMMYFFDLGLTNTGGNHAQLPSEILAKKTGDKIGTRAEIANKVKQDIKKRLSDYGILGLTIHQFKKFQYFVQDGSFGWTVEVVLTENSIVKTNLTKSFIGRKVRDIIYVNRPYYPIYAMFMQIVWWIAVLGLLSYFKKFKKASNTELFFQLTLFGGILFLSLFEAGRSRYLIQFLPAIIMLSSIGYLNYFNNRQTKQIQKNL